MELKTILGKNLEEMVYLLLIVMPNFIEKLQLK